MGKAGACYDGPGFFAALSRVAPALAGCCAFTDGLIAGGRTHFERMSLKGPLGSARRLPGWISGLERGRGSADRRWERGSFLLRLCLGKWLMLFSWLCLSLWLIQDFNWKGRALWRLSGGLATVLQDWISCNEQKMREAHITRRETSFYLFMIFIEKISNRKLKHSLFFEVPKG